MGGGRAPPPMERVGEAVAVTEKAKRGRSPWRMWRDSLLGFGRYA